MPSPQQNVTNIPSNRVDFIDPRTGLVSREWYRFFVNLFNLSGAGGNQTSLDDLQVGPPPQPVSESGGGGGAGTVTSVDMTVPTGLAVSGNPITTAGTLAVTYASGYAIPTTAKQTEWDTAYTDRLKWDGNATGLVAATGRTSLGATTVGGNFFTLPDPSAITFVQINADNTITTMDAPTFRTAIGAGTGGGSVTSVGTSGTVNGLTLTGGPITTTGTITLGGTLDLSSPPDIGGTTPAAGTFTTLTALGQTSLGGAAGAEGLRVLTTASAVNYIQATGRETGAGVRLGVGGTDTNVNFQVYAKGTGAVRFFTGSDNSFNAAEQTRVSHTASAVNYVQVTGAATGGNVTLSAQGSDSAIGITYLAKGGGSSVMKGDGGVFWQNNAGANLFSVENTASSVNRLTATGGATGFGVRLFAQGSDTNISQVFQSKGTGAIDLAAGSRGVNISNGGTVTAITRTAIGGSYTSAPTIAISAPTTAGGVQATATCTLIPTNNPSIVSGGTGYTVGDVLTFVGGTGTAQQMTVTTVAAGVITAASSANTPAYSVAPSNNISVTGGTGTGATFSVASWCIGSTFTITNAGSGYVEQPTVTFSGGGGSGAAAYATVGSTPKIQSLGTNLSFFTPGGEQFRVADTTSAGTAVNFIQTSGNLTGAAPRFVAVGADTNVGIVFSSKGTSDLSFRTNGTNQVQMTVAHTASAVNYVQVTGGVTGSQATISAQGSDANVGLIYTSKGTSSLQFRTNGSAQTQMFITHTASAVNYVSVTGAAAGAAPVYSVAGTDTNIDLTLTPKGTGVVRTSGTGIRLYGSSSGYVGLTGAAAAGSTTYTLPAADGTSGQFLSTNGSGTLSWSTGGGSNITAQGLWENNKTISSNYSVTSGNNALSAGPITVASGVTVTVPSGSVWTIV